MSKTLIHAMRHHAEHRPEKIFWRHQRASQTEEISFGQFYRRAQDFALVYRARGLAPGQVVLIFLPHHQDATAAFFGAMLIGAIPSFMPCPSAKQHPSIYWPSHIDLLRRIGAPVLLADAHHAAQMREHGLAASASQLIEVESVGPGSRALPAGGADESAIALLQHSSGTTSLKKGVALSHRAIVLQVEAYAARLRMRPQDNIVSWLPLYHDMGLIACAVTPLLLGQTVTCLDPFEWSARPAGLFDAIQAYNGTFTWMPNFGFELMARVVPPDYPADLSGMRAFISCSEPCKPDTLHRFRKRFAKLGVRPRHLQVCYAMAETVFAVSQTHLGKPAGVVSLDTKTLQSAGIAVDCAAGAKATDIASTGAPLPGLDVRIVNAAGEALAANQVGEVTLAGPFLFDGYFNDPQKTAERIVAGAYHTNDLGFMRDGELFILGRKDDLIIVNGRNLYAHEVEAIVARIAGLKPGRAVAFGMFEPELGSEVLVVVAERDPATAAPDARQLGRAVRAAVYDVTNIDVSRFLAVDPGWLVKTTSGKISRHHNRMKYLDQLKSSVAEGQADPAAERLPASQAASPVASSVVGIIGAMFNVPLTEIDAGTVASDVPGWTSLAHAALILEVERQLRIRFGDQEIFGFATVGDLERRASQLQAERQSPVDDERTVLRTPTASIVRFDGAGPSTGTGPDLIIFAGRANKLGGMDLLDFASVLGKTAAGGLTKYYVTDLAADWYLSCFEEVVAKLNAVSTRPKLLLGNSMGGYAALRFSAALHNVVATLAFVPQRQPVRPAAKKLGVSGKAFRVGFAPSIAYCVLFGETEDDEDRAHLAGDVTDADRQRILTVRNCGHNVVPYLHSADLLGRVIDCLTRPTTFCDEVAAIVATIPADPVSLEQRQRYTERRRARVAARRAAKARPGALPPAS